MAENAAKIAEALGIARPRIFPARWGGEWPYMTVGELIEELQKYPPDTPIVHEYDSSWGTIRKPKLLDKGPDNGPPVSVLWINPDEWN